MFIKGHIQTAQWGRSLCAASWAETYRQGIYQSSHRNIWELPNWHWNQTRCRDSHGNFLIRLRRCNGLLEKRDPVCRWYFFLLKHKWIWDRPCTRFLHLRIIPARKDDASLTILACALRRLFIIVQQSKNLKFILNFRTDELRLWSFRCIIKWRSL